MSDPIHDMLKDFCAAHYGCPERNVIKVAIQEFILARLAAEPEIRERYERARARRLQNGGHVPTGLHVVPR